MSRALGAAPGVPITNGGTGAGAFRGTSTYINANIATADSYTASSASSHLINVNYGNDFDNNGTYDQYQIIGVRYDYDLIIGAASTFQFPTLYHKFDSDLTNSWATYNEAIRDPRHRKFDFSDMRPRCSVFVRPKMLGYVKGVDTNPKAALTGIGPKWIDTAMSGTTDAPLHYGYMWYVDNLVAGYSIQVTITCYIKWKNHYGF